MHTCASDTGSPAAFADTSMRDHTRDIRTSSTGPACHAALRHDRLHEFGPDHPGEHAAPPQHWAARPDIHRALARTAALHAANRTGPQRPQRPVRATRAGVCTAPPTPPRGGIRTIRVSRAKTESLRTRQISIRRFLADCLRSSTARSRRWPAHRIRCDAQSGQENRRGNRGRTSLAAARRARRAIPAARATSAERAEEAVRRAYRRFDGSRVRTYVPLLVEHAVRDELGAQ
jgi:hypothetical protein